MISFKEFNLNFRYSSISDLISLIKEASMDYHDILNLDYMAYLYRNYPLEYIVEHLDNIDADLRNNGIVGLKAIPLEDLVDTYNWYTKGIVNKQETSPENDFTDYTDQDEIEVVERKEASFHRENESK